MQYMILVDMLPIAEVEAESEDEAYNKLFQEATPITNVEFSIICKSEDPEKWEDSDIRFATEEERQELIEKKQHEFTTHPYGVDDIDESKILKKF